jgi:hypothetical protein
VNIGQACFTVKSVSPAMLSEFTVEFLTYLEAIRRGLKGVNMNLVRLPRLYLIDPADFLKCC